MNDHLTISTFELIQKFPDAETARLYLENQRWKGKPVCPHCGGTHERIKARKGKRIGYYWCNDCGQEFTVRTGTIFERSHVKLHKWIYAMYLTVTERKGVSSLQLSKLIGVTQKTAWFMQQRIREACGNEGGELLKGIIEADETYIGGKRPNMSNAKQKALKKAGAGRGTDGKKAVLGLRQRGGKTIALPVEDVTGKTLKAKIEKHVAKGSHVYTDETAAYKGMKGYKHHSVNHSDRIFVGANDIHTNSIESVWAVLKRGLYGVWHHASTKHLHRYVNEATFRLNEGRCDEHTNNRIDAMLHKAIGPRITYKEVIA